MPYLMLDDFAAGIDHRKSALTAKPGTLRELKNAVVTAGGEIEKRKTFASLGTLPAGLTHGLSFNGTTLIVFGTDAPAAVNGQLPLWVSYQQLVPGDAETITRIMDVQTFSGKLYVIAAFSDGSTRHFYDGTLVPSAQVEGTAVRAHKSKLYCVDGQNLRFSSVLSATDWTGAGGGAGSGVIDVTTEDAGDIDLVGLEQYYNALAVFGRTSVQIWALDPDPLKNTLVQTLGNVGLVAPNGVTRYGNGDVLFLSDTGIRSLRARDASNAASLNDVGSAIDALIADRRGALTPTMAQKITAVVDPLTGRFWLVWGNEVFVLSTYPNTKVSAWSRFTLPGVADYVTVAGSRLVARVGDDLRLYGVAYDGASNPFDPNTPLGNAPQNYDSTEVIVETPFLDAQMPATVKRWVGLDVSCAGAWEVYINPDYATPNGGKWTKVATLDMPTWQLGRVPLDMQSTHLAVRLRSASTGPASVASLGVHFEQGEAA